VILGNILMVLSAVSWAISMLSARNMKWHNSPISMLPWQLLVALVPVMIMCFLWEPHPRIIWNLPLTAVLLYCGVLATAFAYWAVIVVSKELPVVTTSLALLSVPVLSVIASALLLHEPVDFNTIVAMSLILIGLFFGVLGGRPKIIKQQPIKEASE
jgi:drug/metabolite transporter (DMT)-like permease